MDGKTLKVSHKDVEEAYKDFIQIVSVYSTTVGLVVGMAEWLRQESSELVVVQNLIKTLGIEDAVLTLDALPKPKKTTEVIIKSKKHYLRSRQEKPKKAV